MHHGRVCRKGKRGREGSCWGQANPKTPTCWWSPGHGLRSQVCETGRVGLGELIRTDLWGCCDVSSWERKQGAVTHNVKNIR